MKKATSPVTEQFSYVIYLELLMIYRGGQSSPYERLRLHAPNISERVLKLDNRFFELRAQNSGSSNR